MSDSKVTFVIPTYNEEEGIQRTIEAIVSCVPDKLDHEVIVVDHGSQDNTCNIASEMPVILLSHPNGTIASLRNHGAQHATGNVLVFIDADVILTANWSERFGEIAPSLIAGERVMTGSWVCIPENANWIEKNWFKPLQKGKSTHINSGHMIITKNIFDEIGGFNEDLETGEDYEISMRAKSHGLVIFDDVQLEAVHKGYPRNLKEFFLREFWHGKGDAQSLTAIFSSKVVSVSLLFFVLHFALITVFLESSGPLMVSIILISILFLVFAVSLIKYRGESSKVILTNCFLYYVYLWARVISLVALFDRKTPVKRER
jgi:glycosyltransferase involved in cell wall biosynthesis